MEGQRLLLLVMVSLWEKYMVTYRPDARALAENVREQGLTQS